jgi:hypothetical protein
MKKLKTFFSLWYRKMFGVLTLEECKSEGLYFCHNIYGDTINQYSCRSIWRDSKGNPYRCESLGKRKKVLRITEKGVVSAIPTKKNDD